MIGNTKQKENNLNRESGFLMMVIKNNIMDIWEKEIYETIIS